MTILRVYKIRSIDSRMIGSTVRLNTRNKKQLRNSYVYFVKWRKFGNEEWVSLAKWPPVNPKLLRKIIVRISSASTIITACYRHGRKTSQIPECAETRISIEHYSVLSTKKTHAQVLVRTRGCWLCGCWLREDADRPNERRSCASSTKDMFWKIKWGPE